MNVFKFGGASVKDADAVRNVARILQKTGTESTVVVVSAMGKTTNALERVVAAYFNTPHQMHQELLEIKAMHLSIVKALFEKTETIALRIQELFGEMERFLNHNKSPHYSFVYDQLVSYGELLSTSIIHHYLLANGLPNDWLDARRCVKTDAYYRNAHLNWDTTQQRIKEQIQPKNLTITQGFIGSDTHNFTTTLGREGSDYTAAIFAYALNAVSVTIWKDVPGVLNADPRHFDQTVLLEQISYREAIELAFYGASVIHPKTLQPLQRKEIPLFVKSFANPENSGTAVSKGKTLVPKTPCFIVKQEQVLLRLSSLDFSFIVEDTIRDIFALLHEYQMRVELIQNSAISFSVCLSNKYHRLEELLQALRSNFKVQLYEDVTLYTIRHFNDTAIRRIKSKKETVLLEQRTQETLQLVVQ